MLECYDFNVEYDVFLKFDILLELRVYIMIFCYFAENNKRIFPPFKGKWCQNT